MKRLVLIMLIFFCAGCSGALTPTLTPTIPVTIAVAPTPMPFPTSPSCNNMAGAEKNARDFIARYNASDVEGTLAFVSEKIQSYLDGSMGFNGASQAKNALRTFFAAQFQRGDKFEIREVKAQVDPANNPPLYAITMDVSRSVGGAVQRGMIQMAIECESRLIVIVAVITN